MINQPIEIGFNICCIHVGADVIKSNNREIGQDDRELLLRRRAGVKKLDGV